MLVQKQSAQAIVLLPLLMLIAFIGFLGVLDEPWAVLTDILPHFSHSTTEDDGALTYLHPGDHNSRNAQLIELQWNITKSTAAPDGVEKPVYLINGQFPGPTLEMRSGDSLRVHVQNQLLDNETVSFHWHGLHMRGANHMDGVVGVTQDAIRSGASFVYEFNIPDDQAGTFWYHSHSELQRADGLFGGLIVHEPFTGAISSGSADYDALMMIGDWYHRPAPEIQASYIDSGNWGMEPAPDSLLLNGRGAFNCSSAVPGRPVQCKQQEAPTIRLRSGKHRLRIVNVGAMCGVTVSIPELNMIPVFVDGGNAVSELEPASSIGILYPGERIDVVTDVPNMLQSFLSVELDDENFALQNKALTVIHHFPIGTETVPFNRSIAKSHTYYNLSEAQGVLLAPDLLQARPDQTILVYATVEMLQHLGNIPVGLINHTSWAPQKSPQKPLVELSREQYDENQLVPFIPFENRTAGQHRDVEHPPRWVDIVINNIGEGGHPFHLHGYDFYVLQVWKSQLPGWYAYNPYDIDKDTGLPPGGPYNLEHPLKKDTVFIPQRGYAVLRIRADNPGLWFLHCHILWHQGTGMAMTVQVK